MKLRYDERHAIARQPTVADGILTVGSNLSCLLPVKSILVGMDMHGMILTFCHICLLVALKPKLPAAERNDDSHIHGVEALAEAAGSVP